VKVQVNGALRELSDDTTITRLLTVLGVPPDGVAVAVDGAVVPRSRHAETTLAHGARIEVVRAVGGG